jgi:hypothetical protein
MISSRVFRPRRIPRRGIALADAKHRPWFKNYKAFSISIKQPALLRLSFRRLYG